MTHPPRARRQRRLTSPPAAPTKAGVLPRAQAWALLAGLAGLGLFNAGSSFAQAAGDPPTTPAAAATTGPTMTPVASAAATPSAAPVASAASASTAKSATLPVVAEQGPRWASLSQAQRQALEPLQKDWSGIEASRKVKWLEVAARMPSMTPEERDRVRQRMVEWSRLSPAERGRARFNFQEARSMPPEDRQARWEAYQALSDEERRALAAQAKASARPPPTPPGQTKAPEPKRNTVPEPAPVMQVAKPVAPTVVQARPGATTTLVTRPSSPPAHQQPGLPKIAASEEDVDPVTLLPRRGPQAAKAAVAAAGAAAPARQP